MIYRHFLLIIILALTLSACQKPTDTASADVASLSDASVITDGSVVGDGSVVSGATVDLSAETEQYRAWVEGQIEALLVGTQDFVDALKAGDVAKAKQLYPVVRMNFERSEPIAESFGDLDPRLDNREADLEVGENWTGFHAIEKILWEQNTTKGTEQLAEQLLADVKELHAKLPTAEVTGELMVQGAVDLLNEVSTSKITGEEEIFSKTDLYDFKANVEGAEKIFELLKPKLTAKDPALVATLEQRFSAVDTLLDSHKDGDGYVSYDKLSADDTKALGEAVNKLAEPLAQMGVILA